MAFIVTFSILFVFWIFISGHLDWWHLSWGVLCCALVAYISHDFLFKDIRSKGKIKETINFIKYIPWLLYQIIRANIYIAYLALHPRMPKLIDPHIIRFKTKLKKDLSLVTFANSITLTPGTITVLIKDGYFYVHAIDRTVAEALPGKMEDRIYSLYMED
ncbi:MAG: Na+/H+ antiporter subunit E [Deltaproteobacteria bacterium]|nr:Na+/H+ antiporter subunit E [Deltaproteobacteria bacterium]